VRGATVRVDGRTVVNWCSNDYLGLSAHPALADAAAGAAASWGVGARASRLLAGSTALHDRLEQALAAWFGAARGIVYSSGYLANLGILGAVLGPKDLVVVDRLAHASLVDAARASRARLRVFRHNDPEHLAAVLARSGKARRRLVVTEGLFSMDGDQAPLRELLSAADAHGAILYVDDAHGAFALGPTGRGTPEACRVPHSRLLYFGTLGKALGCQGGFLVGPAPLIEYLHNRSRTFIYSTALSVPVVAASLAALTIVSREPERRARLWQRVRQLAGHAAPPWTGEASYILPVMAGTAERAGQWAAALWRRGAWAPAIRPPTVPRGTARLRISVTAAHTASHVDALGRALARLQRRGSDA